MEKLYLTAQECAELLGISLGHSYRICRELNKELEAKNYITVAGKVPRAYLRYYTGQATINGGEKNASV